MNSPLATIAKQLRRLPWNKKYWGDASLPQQSELDHISFGIILALSSIICGMLWTPLYWLYLASWLYHAIFIELVWDSIIKDKNTKMYKGYGEYGQDKYIPPYRMFNWNAVIAQLVERTIGHIICLPVLIWRLM